MFLQAKPRQQLNSWLLLATFCVVMWTAFAVARMPSYFGSATGNAEDLQVGRAALTSAHRSANTVDVNCFHKFSTLDRIVILGERNSGWVGSYISCCTHIALQICGDWAALINYQHPLTSLPSPQHECGRKYLQRKHRARHPGFSGESL